MSGIIGTYHQDGRPADEADLARMMERIAHRGPDGRSVWRDGPVGLGHALLHTTPESLHEELPAQLATQGGDVSIAADARIDNRAELLRALSIEAGNGLPDSMLILHAYAQWGVDCLQHLIGDFAFALWDASEQRLLCARDHMGVRPLYYHTGADGQVVFASEIKAIVAHSAARPALNEQRMLDLLLGTRIDQEATIYEGVKRLPPAHALIATPDGVEVKRYWSLTPDETVGDDWSDAAYAERFRELFEEAVRCRSRSAFPVGADLSGGLDSSAVACVARNVLAEEGRTPLHAFSYTFDDTPASDEREYAQAVLEQGGFEPHWLSGDDVGPLTDIETIYGAVIDDYLVGGMHYMIWKSYAAAQDAGVRVMMNGFDGDTTVSHGILRLRELVEGGDWSTFSKEVHWLAERHSDLDHYQPFEEMLGSAGALFDQFARPQLKTLAENKQWIAFLRAARVLSRYFTVTPRSLVRQYWRYLFLPEAIRHWPHDMASDEDDTSGGGKTAHKLDLVPDDVIQRFGLNERLKAARNQRKTLFDGVRAKQQSQFATPALTEGLEAMNHYGAHHRLVPQFPFMDIRLIRFCLALPTQQSLQGGWTRFIFRRAMDGILPDRVRRRVGKARMWAANRHALLEQNAGALRRHMDDLGPLARYVDRHEVESLYKNRYHLKPHNFILLQRTVTLAAWTKLRFEEIRDTHPTHSVAPST